MRPRRRQERCPLRRCNKRVYERSKAENTESELPTLAHGAVHTCQRESNAALETMWRGLRAGAAAWHSASRSDQQHLTPENTTALTSEYARR